MREIKFRCWDVENKEMLDVQELDYADSYDGNPMIRTTMYSDYFDTEEMILMQYTGLKDKNGKEIYEGDIVSKEVFDDTKPNYINKSYAKVVYIEELAGFYLVNKSNKILWEVADDKYNIEVVSTIYDNPELLGGENGI